MKKVKLFSLTIALTLVLSSLLGVGSSLAITGFKHYKTFWTRPQLIQQQSMHTAPSGYTGPAAL